MESAYNSAEDVQLLLEYIDSIKQVPVIILITFLSSVPANLTLKCRCPGFERLLQASQRSEDRADN
ncbi:hypothetical protein ACU8KH_05155 [Lachancea thermotolerans]